MQPTSTKDEFMGQKDEKIINQINASSPKF